MARKYRNFVYDENQRFIYPTSDWGFKYLLGSETNKDILIGVLKKLLPDLGIESVDFLARDFKIPIGKMKDGSFDVHCKLSDGSRVVIEMQNYVRQTFIDRAIVYTSTAVLESFINSRAKGYRIGRTIFIAFVGDSLFKDVARTPIRIALCDIDENNTTQRTDKVLQIFVEMPKFTGSITDINKETPFLEKLSYVLMEMADCSEMPENLGDPILESLFRAADTSKMEVQMKENYMKSIIGETDYEAGLEDAREEGWEMGHEDGMEKGLKEGRQKGLEEGLKEGLEKGLEKGREEGKLSIAKAMIATGKYSSTEISEVTGLSEKKIKEIVV